MKPRSTPMFDSHGTEGMLDVILGCTLIFLLLTALVKVNEGQSQERSLPDMELTRAANSETGATEVKRTMLSIRQEAQGLRLWFDDTEIEPQKLAEELARLGAGAQVALRRDRSLPCNIEDEIIIACRDAGIERVAIVIEQKEK